VPLRELELARVEQLEAEPAADRVRRRVVGRSGRRAWSGTCRRASRARSRARSPPARCRGPHPERVTCGRCSSRCR